MIKTQSGRNVSPPTIRVDTKRKTNKDSKLADSWLRSEAIKEAQFMRNSHLERIFTSTNPNKLTEAEKELMNDYLFGEESPAIYQLAGI